MKKKFPIKKLGSIAKITMGQSPQSKFYNQEDMGIPLIQGNADLKDGVTSPRMYTTSVTKKVDVGDIIMSVRAPVGELAISSHEACIGRGVCSIQAKNEQNLFLYYLLQHYRGNITKYSQGSTFDSINSSDIQKVEVPYPTTEEQQKIASILSTWDEGIKLYQDLLDNKRKYFQELSNQLLQEKKSWKSYCLGDVGITYNGLTGKTKKDFGEGQKYIPYKNVFDNSKIDIDDYDLVKISTGEKQNKIQYGDVVFTISSETADEVGMSSVALDDFDESVYLNSFCFGYRFTKDRIMSPRFSRFYFRGIEFRKNMYRLAQGSTRFNLSKKEFLKIIITIPPTIKEQEFIAQILENHEKEMTLIDAMIIQLQEQKRGLMQLLLTGKVRV